MGVLINISGLMKRTFLALVVVATSALLLTARAEEGADKPKADPATAFAKIDANSDGSMTKAEFVASPRGQKDPEKAAKKFTKMDADANGSVSLDEFKASAVKKDKKDDKAANDGGGALSANLLAQRAPRVTRRHQAVTTFSKLPWGARIGRFVGSSAHCGDPDKPWCPRLDLLSGSISRDIALRLVVCREPQTIGSGGPSPSSLSTRAQTKTPARCRAGAFATILPFIPRQR